MPASPIVIKGAREHNLRGVDLELPRNELICLTGVSGSGKSSLAFDTLFAEGQRRYVESLSSFARHFLGQMPKPEVDYIGGLSPSISISQKSTGNNPRSTVGTITEIYDYLRVLYARVGTGHCPQCERPISAQSREEVLARLLQLPEGTRFLVLAPLIRGQKGEYRDLFIDLLKQGFARARVDGEVVQLSDDLRLDRQMRHEIEVVVDRLTAGPKTRPRLAEAVELALRVGKGTLLAAVIEEEEAAPAAEAEPPKRGKRSRQANRPGDIICSVDYACTHCGLSFETPSPQLFSFNSPQGMCSQCDGLGELYSFDVELLVPDASLSFKDGCFVLEGPWAEVGRWRKHIFQGVAETIERIRKLPAGAMLETPWRELPEELREVWLWGAGNEHITFSWKTGSATQKYGGRWEGIIPELLGKHRTSQSKMQIRKLEKFMSQVACPDCHGSRLNPQAGAVRIRSAVEPFASRENGLSLPEVCALPVSRAAEFFAEPVLSETQQMIAVEALKEIRQRLGFLLNVGLEYLTLDRTAPTLSGGESQRIRLAGQIGSGLVGVTYILDEPSIGLHPRDNDRLLSTLTRLRDMGNTVVVVEHDEDTMRAADRIIDFGPGPGVRGGEVVAEGTARQVMRAERSITGQYLAGKRRIAVPEQRRAPSEQQLVVVNATQNNLKGVDVAIPLGLFVCVTGVSGSGKSSLVNDILSEALRRDLNGGEAEPGAHERIEGLGFLDKLIAIDQSPIGRTPRSNPGTYIKVFDDIRSLFTVHPEAKQRGYKPGRFSFNVEGGRCEACQGNGSNKLEMDFLADIWVTCPVCAGKRFNRETLEVRYKGHSIADVLEMDIQQLLEVFENVPNVQHKLQTLHDVGLDYVKLGQPSPTLSGGEAQRIKLARELVKKSTGRTLYLLDEPTTGLHFADVEMLLRVLHDFVEAGNTVLVVEHNLDVIKTADWVIDLGPEGGSAGGRVVVAGTPEEVAAHPESHTGRALAGVLGTRGDSKKAAPKAGGGKRAARVGDTKIVVRGASQHNLRGVDVTLDRDAMTVFCGPSGSGKTSLAMDTIYAEGQRRYVESLSAYARQFVGQMQKPAIEHIEGLSPAIAIEQKNLGSTPRSTVGTVTEVYDYLRILTARMGKPFCPECDLEVSTQTSDEIVDKLQAEPEGTKLYLLAPLEVAVGQKYETLWADLRASGYSRVRIDGVTYGIEETPAIDRRRRHAVEVVVDRVVIREGARKRLADSVEQALSLGHGVMRVAWVQEEMEETRWRVDTHSQHLACHNCGRSFEPLSPHSFSFNSPLGWCEACEGLGTQTGANPNALIRNAGLTLAKGAVALWPNVELEMSQAMLAALSAGTGIPLDVPYSELSARHRRMLLHGSGDQWFKVAGRFSFQFKGLYPALEEAAKLSPTLRTRLEHLVDEVECSACGGSRLRDDAAAVRLVGRTIDQYCSLPLGKLLAEVEGWKLSAREQKIAGELAREIIDRVRFLCDVGLEYLTLGRGAATLSNGEAQRIRLASQLGSALCGVLYVLDEPTIGLHPRDNGRLLAALHKLRDLGNTLLIVEHDREVIAGADYLCDFGPGAGRLGGQIVAEGKPAGVGRKRDSLTGAYLSGRRAIAVPSNRRMAPLGPPAEPKAKPKRKKKAAPKKKASAPPAKRETPPGGGWLEVIGARQNNLKGIDIRLPLGTLTAVTGVSGGGKSSLIDDVLYRTLARRLHRASLVPGGHDEIRGIEHINKVIRVDQQPLGNSPTSNPATYTGAFDLIRTLFSQLPEARVRGYTARRFSFNVPGGRCETCEGNGQLRIEMHFLPDVWVTCDTCRGRRYNPETLAVQFHGRSISDVLDMTCGEARELFGNIPNIRRILQTLCDVGLDYLTLGQPAPTLSGGEAQRVKLAGELARPDTGRTLYLLDEPTTGLHFEDLAKLLEVLQRLVDLGNTVVLIEHNLDIIKCADWVIDMGPEAGEGGGRMVACGTPEDIAAHAAAFTSSNGSLRSHTGEALAPVLAAGPHADREPYDPAALHEQQEGDLALKEVGRDAKMPWEVDGRQWHCVDRVGRRGEPCRWEGKALAEVVDRIHQLGTFSETNWNNRSVVEISAERKSDGWFFHAITGEAWLVKLKFRVPRNTFRRDDIETRLALPALNDLPDLPVYGNEPRVRCRNLRGPWQEIQLHIHSFAELDRPEFWSFLEQAVAAFAGRTEKVADDPEALMPWKKLGRKWHLSRRGFPPGKKVQWHESVLEQLCELLIQAAPEGQMLWNNQQLVHMFLPGQREPWATVHTKRLASVDLVLTGPKDRFAFGRITGLGHEPDFDTSPPGHDLVKLSFRSVDDLVRGDFPEFLGEHRAALTNGSENR